MTELIILFLLIEIDELIQLYEREVIDMEKLLQ